MDESVLALLREKPLAKSELAKQLGKSRPTRYLNDLMARLLKEECVEYTIPDKPNSRLQKYRIKNKRK
jgi:ATP-dependent DNA helicase RecG